MGAVIGRESRTAVCLMHRSARSAAKDRSYRVHATSVGAVIGRESSTAVCLMHRSARFAAKDRFYRVHATSVGAVTGREGRTAVCLMHRSARFAAKDRSYRVHATSVGAVIGRESSTAVCLMHRSARFAAKDRSYRCSFPCRSGHRPRKPPRSSASLQTIDDHRDQQDRPTNHVLIKRVDVLQVHRVLDDRQNQHPGDHMPDHADPARQ